MTAMPADAPDILLGRRREQQLLAGLMGGAREGRSGVLVVRGEAGIGKTALISSVLGQSADFRVIQGSGAEAEMELAYAGVQQICAPLVSLLNRLPAPQRHALQVALGIADGPGAPDRLLVGLALLTLLSEAGAEQPTICVVDDAHWVDRASMQAFGFTARRLLADRVVMLFAARHRIHPLGGLPELELRGLSDGDARALLTALVPGRLTDRARDSIVAESGGNPLALLELHRAFDAIDLAGGYGLAQAKSVSSRIEDTFVRQLGALPAPTRTLLLVAAAEPTGEPEWLWEAAAHLGIGVDAAAPAEMTGLISLHDHVRFRHPLVRSAIYRSAPLSERRRVHDALAHAITAPGAADHRAWHRAHAAAAPDEDVAVDLVHAAEQARARGGIAAAAAFLSAAVDATPDQHWRARRAVQAAQAKLDAGAPDKAEPLLDIAIESAGDEVVRAHVDLVRAKMAFAARRGRDGPPLLLAAAHLFTAIDAAAARETYLEALMSSLIVGRLAADERSEPAAIARAAREDLAEDSPRRAVDLLLDGLIVRLTEGYAAAVPALQKGIRAYLDEVDAGTADPRWHDVTNRVCLDLFDQDSYNIVNTKQVELLRAAGELTVLPSALATYAGMWVTSGEFGKAETALQEVDVITTATDTPPHLAIRSYLAAYRGQEKHCLEYVNTTIRDATARGEGSEVTVARYAAAVLHNGLAQYREALAATSAGLEYDDVGMSVYLLTEAVEAASRAGAGAEAADALARLRERARASGTATALGLAARSLAMAGDDADADDEFLCAIDYLERSPAVVYLARTQLLYGEWLRRANRRADARTQLRIAYDMFARMGADGFAARARRELRATGETVHSPAKGESSPLTGQELHIARLARDGYTNSEIGAQLFISPRTVEWHLGRIFAKLGVTSRRELRSAPVDLA